MNNRETKIKISSWVSIIIAIAACLFSLFQLNIEKLDLKFLLIAIITLTLSSSTQIQLPRTKIHFSLSETFIFFVLLIYGLEYAVLMAAAETICSSLIMRWRKVNIKTTTIFLNASITTISIFCAGIALQLISQAFNYDVTIHDFQSLTVLLLAISATHFLVNSILIAFFSSLKTEQTFWQVLNKNCFNALLMYLIAAPLTAVMIKTADNVNPILMLAGLMFAGIAYITYRRYIEDIKNTSLKAEQAERMRAEQAEKHVLELQHYISEIESGSKALKESEKKLRHTAFYDTLTDLPNRNKFLERLQFLIERTKYEPNLRFAVLFIDLNRFKAINDSLGHSIGNELIKYVANRLKGLIREDDLAARFGSDEFAIILNNISGMEEAEYFAQTIDSTISDPFTLKGRQVFTSPSIGIALNDSRYDLAENLLRDADIAMYNAKASNIPYKFFDQNMHTEAVTRLQIETDLRYAIERKELVVYYQPIIDLNTIELIGFEALMRWQHPIRGLIPPFEFIPISETTGQIVPMTLWILRESCRQVVEWTQMFGLKRCPMISVNLSGKHFTQPNLVEQIKNITEETGINVGSLKLEITESAVMENAESAIRMLKQLRELGVQLSIDDFGTGYSSLSYLHSFPINALKVDRSFVCAMESGTENGEIVRTIIALAKALNLSVIAEGIESIHQLHQLRILGCEYGQGYLFSRPVPKDEAVKLLMNSSQWKAILPHPQNRVVKHQNDFGLLELDEPLTDTRDIIQ